MNIANTCSICSDVNSNHFQWLRSNGYDNSPLNFVFKPFFNVLNSTKWYILSYVWVSLFQTFWKGFRLHLTMPLSVMQMHITLTLNGTRKSLLQLKISPLYSMTIHPKPNRALYCTLVGKSKPNQMPLPCGLLLLHLLTIWWTIACMWSWSPSPPMLCSSPSSGH
jgi:hypothetical protein